MLSLDRNEAFETKITGLKQTLMAPDPDKLGPIFFPELFQPLEVDSLDAIPEGVEAEFVNTIRDDEIDDLLAAMGQHR